MSIPVDIDNMNYQRKLDRDDARDEFLHNSATQLSTEWATELATTGIILDLGWEQAEVNLQAKEEKKTPGKYLYARALTEIIDNTKDLY